MSENSIHDFDVNIICEYFSTMNRQGPGSEEATRLAAQFLKALPKRPVMADLGCGTGGPTVTLAKCFPDAEITAIDLFPKFIDLLKERAWNESVKIKAMTGSMGELPFRQESLDVIWCEGAVYNIGFRHALHYWKPFLKPGGYIALTEVSWLTDERPSEIDSFWKDAYQEIDTLPNKLAQIIEAGYKPVGMFLLGRECWTDNFYTPALEAQTKFMQRYPDDPTASMLIENQRHEAEMYGKYSDYYGYVFYICKAY